MQTLGYNYRIPDMLCALGLSQLKKASAGITRRREIASLYNEAFKNIKGLTIQDPSLQEGHAFHLYIIRTDKRKELYDYLKSKNIFPQVHYIPVHLMPYYKELGFKKGDFPNAEKYYSECLSLPMYPSITNEEIRYVIECVTNFMKGL
jgi:dTDP-4-amino-4,6-dideoxygalactose transaminase